MVKLISKEIGYEFEYEEYKGSLTDLPEGTAIQLQSPGQPSMHFVRQDGLWYEITLGESITSFSIESSSHATVTILYNPDNDKSQSHEEPSAMYLIQIPTPPLRVLVGGL